MKKERKNFTPKKGNIYENEGGGKYLCLEVIENTGKAIMKNIKSNWRFYAHGCGIYENGKIDWNYSTEGHFDKEENYI